MSVSRSLSSILASLRVDIADGAVVELAAPGAIRFPAGQRAYLHFVISGSVILEVAETPEPVRVDEGGYVIVIGTRGHVLADALGRTPGDARYFQDDHHLDRLPTLRFGGGGKVVKLLTSVFSIDPSAKAVLRGLPEILGGGSRVSDGPLLLDPRGVADLLYGPGTTALLAALTNLCFVKAVRTALMGVWVPDEATSAILHYPQLSTAVKMINAQPGHDWTVAKLASAIGMSRSSFSTAFKHHIGETPAAYVSVVRMEQAAAMLIGNKTQISEIARNVGYDSPSSFVRAFKKYFGLAPGDYRFSRQRLLHRPTLSHGHWDPFLP